MEENNGKVLDKAAELRGQKAIDIVRAYKNVFESADGKIVLYDLMQSCSYLKPTYIQGIQSIQINEGRRSVILDILDVMNRSEADLVKFINNSLKREQEEYEL